MLEPASHCVADKVTVCPEHPALLIDGDAGMTPVLIFTIFETGLSPQEFEQTAV